jgi:hypothetical protein
MTNWLKQGFPVEKPLIGMSPQDNVGMRLSETVHDFMVRAKEV